MNINQIFDSENVRKMRNLGNVVSAGYLLCYEQNQCAGEWTAPLSVTWKKHLRVRFSKSIKIPVAHECYLRSLIIRI